MLTQTVSKWYRTENHYIFYHVYLSFNNWRQTLTYRINCLSHTFYLLIFAATEPGALQSAGNVFSLSYRRRKEQNFVLLYSKIIMTVCDNQGFSLGGGTGGPPSWRKFGWSPQSGTRPHFLTRAFPPPPPDICPRKFSKF